MSELIKVVRFINDTLYAYPKGNEAIVTCYSDGEFLCRYRTVLYLKESLNEVKQYAFKKNVDMEGEIFDLLEWYIEGNSIYANPYEYWDDSGLMDFISAIRFDDDLTEFAASGGFDKETSASSSSADDDDLPF